MIRPSRLRALIPAALAAACAKPASPPADTAADEAAINAVREREAMLVAQGNADSMLTIYTADVKFLPPGEPMLDGKEAARKWIEASFAQVTMAPQYASSSITVAGDWAVDRYTGTLTVTPKAGGPAMTETIKGLHVMRKGADGTWRIAQDIWNADAPPPAPAPAPPARP